MKLLADQNIRVQTVEFLRQLGHDVADTRELGLQRASDQDVAMAAAREDRVIITFNGDYGSILDFPPGRYPGVVRLRIEPQTEEVLHPLLQELFSVVAPERIRGALVVLENTQIRIRRVIDLQSEKIKLKTENREHS